MRAQGITTSTFGLGADFDEQVMAGIATHGGGHFYFIEQAQQIPDLLASELGEVLDVVARDVETGRRLVERFVGGLRFELVDGCFRLGLERGLEVSL